MRLSAEDRVVWLVAAIQVVIVLGFTMVMPLGPDFAAALRIPNSQIGLIAGSYMVSAAAAGVAGSFVLDRFDRRRALAVTLLGWSVAMVLVALSVDLPTLIAARIVGGLFGGPATALGLALIADTVPAARRGRAMGLVTGSFSIAAVFGIPAGLEMARLGGWQLPFFAIAALGLVAVAGALRWLPHGATPPPAAGESSILRTWLRLMRPMPLTACAYSACATLSLFLLVPNIAAYVQHNLGYPRAELGLLFFAGGVGSILVLRAGGWWIDRVGSVRVAIATTALLGAVLYFFFMAPTVEVPIMVLFVLFMAGTQVRHASVQTLTTKVPAPQERAGLMSLVNAVQNFSCAAGAIASSAILVELPGGALEGIGPLAGVALALALAVPGLMWMVERRLAGPRAA